MGINSLTFDFTNYVGEEIWLFHIFKFSMWKYDVSQ